MSPAFPYGHTSFGSVVEAYISGTVIQVYLQLRQNSTDVWSEFKPTAPT